MQPVSAVFITLLVLLTIGALALCVWSWGWPRLRFARRMATLGLTQLLVVLCVVAGLNASQDFFVTWDDLLDTAGGGDAGATPVVAAPARNGGATMGKATVPSQLQTAVDAAEETLRTRADKTSGVMVSTSIRGTRTGFNLPARIYFPSAYFAKGHEHDKFPVIMFYTGFVGGLDIFQRTLGGNIVLDELIAEKKIPPMLLVIPQQNPSLPADSECVNAVRGDQAETYLALDVPDVLRSDLRVETHRSQWALMGYSTGGFCAANMAMHHPELFANVVSLSGYFHALLDTSTGDLYKGDAQAKKENTPTLTISQPRALGVNFYLTAGGGDTQGMAGIKELAPKIKAPDTLTEVVSGNTGHNFSTWRKALPGAYTWIGKTVTEGKAAAEASTAQVGGTAPPPLATQSPAPGKPGRPGKPDGRHGKPPHTGPQP